MVDELKQSIKVWARQLGFSLAGVTTPEPPPHLEVFDRWLGAGRHGDMGYLARQDTRRRRADPRAILPECQSILVLAAAYPSPSSPSGRVSDGAGVPEARPWEKSNRPRKTASAQGGDGDSASRGRIAAYAWGPDYHVVLQARMKELVRLVEARLGHPTPHRCYADTGPILERELAQRAGLGWIGKNTCLINPQAGSYFLLCEVLLGIKLEPDSAVETDHCGTCTRCLEACPTACILPDRMIDARRCISYLTIELRAEMPVGLRTLTDDWIFGCDICQIVCPWNRFARPVEEGPLAAERPLQPVMADELRLDSTGFSEKYRKTAVKRARRAGYLRNVAVALGNVGTPEDVAALQGLLNDAEDLVRQHAEWAIGRIRMRGRSETATGK